MTPVVHLDRVTVRYGRQQALRDVSASFPPGAVGLLGPNGAGKSTLLKVISGLVRPRAGSVLLEGHDVTGVAPEQRARVGVCLIPEGRGIFPNLTVRENILMDTYGSGGRRASALEDLTFARFPALADRRNQVAGTLSGGEQQMLALSRAMTTDPALILLDELSMGLAPLIVESLFDAVRRIVAEGVTIVIVEQFADVVLSLADEAVVMTRGRIRAAGRPDEVRSRLASAYLGGPDA